MFPLLFPASFAIMLLVERLLGRRDQPAVRGWLPKALVLFALGGFINATVGTAAGGVLRRHALFDLSALGTVGGALVGFAATTFVGYWLHRTWHRYSTPWRWVHQMHHSGERVDVAGFAYGHPFELLLAAGIIPAASILLGINPHAALLAGYFAFMHNLHSHTAIATPRWLGYFIQRPEMHALHHARGVHAYNYGLPLWDRLFGTYRNPATWKSEFGFWDGASREVGAMLIGRDVSTPRQPASAVSSVQAAR